MTRNYILIAALCLAAVLVSSPFAAGQVGVQKGYPAKVSASSKKTVKKGKKLTVKGTITLPTATCALGARPGTGATNCIPIKCPPGVRSLRYCGKPSIPELCAGKVKITIKRGSTTLVTKTVNLNATTCAYSAKLKIKKNAKRGTTKLVARFLGNTILNARSAKALKVKVR